MIGGDARPSRTRIAGLLAVVLLGLFALARPSAQTAAAPDTSPKAVIAAAGKYVEAYTARLETVIAEESYLQETFDSRDHRSGSRLMRGELFLVFLPNDHEWMAVHDVTEVDGQPVTDREDLQALLRQRVTSAIGRRVADRNARFNIGTIARNFNEPTLALLILDAKRSSDFTFSRQTVHDIAGTTVVTLAFTERDRDHHTLVSSPGGTRVFSKGEMDIEAGSGRVRRTRIEFKYGSIQAELTTTYVPDAKLKDWVPSVFTEHYEGERSGLKEIIECTARYSNYRRYETSGRIK